MTDAAHDAESAEALLTATNAFLRSGDLAALARALVDAAGTMFAPSKAAAIFRDGDGRRRVLATLGGPPGDRPSTVGAGDPPAAATATARGDRPGDAVEVLDRALDGIEHCTDDPGSEAFAAQVRAYGAASGLALPIAPTSADGPAARGGVLIVLHDVPTAFDPGTRGLARSLCAQAGIAIELLEARRDLEESRSYLERAVAERTAALSAAVAQLTEANEAKNAFLSNVSHELRTPLTSILGFTDLLLHGLEGPLTQAQHEDLRTIEASGARLLELIDDLIDVSNLEAGEVELRPGPVHVPALLAEVEVDLRTRAAQKGIGVEVTSATAPPVIVADRARLTTILGNLVSNAVKFTPRGGSIRVEASGGADGAIRFTVSDTGIGIQPEVLPHIFERFFRSAAPEMAGTGLGLSIAREYARLHGGEISVESAPHAGSRFTLCLPTLRELAAEPVDGLRADPGRSAATPLAAVGPATPSRETTEGGRTVD